MTRSTAQLAPYKNPGGVVPERINRRELLSCWPTLFEPGKDLDRLYEMLLVIQTPARARTFHQVRSHPNGRKVFEGKPDILALLEDDDYLASLPVDSVGHAYRSFLTTNRLDAGVYSEAVIRPIAQKNNWSEDYYYSVVRNTALHDVLHTITGYGPDAAGEALALGFFCGQTEPAGPIRLTGLALTVITPGASLRHKLRCYQEATKRGRRADNIFAAPWEHLLEKPLGEVRELLGVTSKSGRTPERHLVHRLDASGPEHPDSLGLRQESPATSVKRALDPTESPRHPMQRAMSVRSRWAAFFGVLSVPVDK